jgi:hypothetical protein
MEQYEFGNGFRLLSCRRVCGAVQLTVQYRDSSKAYFFPLVPFIVGQTAGLSTFALSKHTEELVLELAADNVY